MNATLEKIAGTDLATERPAVWRYVVLIGQLILAGLVVFAYEVEGPAFRKVFATAIAGFVVNLWLPLKFRRQFFVLLSLAAAFVVFEPADAVWLIGCGALLIGLCHVPIRFGARVGVVLGVAGLLASSRAGQIPVAWSAAVWPILGSMFMFRLVLYMRAVKMKQVEGGIWGALAYFFMLPNLVFPLFPVVDYQTFRRTYYDKSDVVIYEQGLLWVARGLVHLLLYRVVYQNFLEDPVDVESLGDLAQIMLATFLLYLRVSGQFHLIVGILHLFGFRLPETHNLYYLSHNFTELWRRINIYWKDFMMQVVFYPAYFKLKKRGPEFALGWATAAVFVVTWILHSYQWFWLRGGFPITAPDTLFWGILGALVVAGAVKELKAGRKGRKRVAGWDWRLGVQSAKTFFLFCFLWSLWSTESVSQWLWMLGAATHVDAKGIVLLLVVFGILVALGGRDWEAGIGKRPAWQVALTQPAVRITLPLVLLLIVAQPPVLASLPRPVIVGVESMRATGLNERDSAAQHRGYYEQLDVRGQVNAQLLDVVDKRREGWQQFADVGVMNLRDDYLTRDLLPSRSVQWNGQTFSTNRWGMRDQDYELAKPEGTLRIALMGPSHVMGNGVADGETFEALIEDRLNREFRGGPAVRYEILNFAVDGYALPQQVELLRERALKFSPDVVIVTHYHRNRLMTERFLTKTLWAGNTVPEASLNQVIADAGIANPNRGTIPIPTQTLRSLATRFGMEPRMPAGEFEARVHRISDDFVDRSFGLLVETAREQGVDAVVLALDDVLSDVPEGFPNREAIDAVGLPIFDLFDVFPVEQRASLRVAPWDNHPNKEGHQLIADRLYAELVAYLESDRFAAGKAPLISSTEGK
jgi:hypothetical protein